MQPAGLAAPRIAYSYIHFGHLAVDTNTVCADAVVVLLVSVVELAIVGKA